MKKITSLAVCLILCFAFTACTNNQNKGSDGKEGYPITDIRIFKGTPAWELAKAIESQKIDKIEEIVKDKLDVLNYQDSEYGATLLLWSIGMEKYESAEMLLKCGADPDIAAIQDGETPLFLASGYSWVDNVAKKDSKYVKLLLEYGADPDTSYIGYSNPEYKGAIEKGTTALMNSIGTGIEKTKALVEAGADINVKCKSESTAAISALRHSQNPEYAHYLIAEKKAIINESYYSSIVLKGDDPNKEFYAVDILRKWVFELGSEKHKMKMEIVEEFERQGVDYWGTAIPDRTLKKIKKLYPDTWEEVILKY